MCLAIPAKVLEVHDDKALVDFGGVRREVMLSLVDKEKVKPSDYLIVHVGFAISIMDKKQGEETLKIWRDILSK